MSYNPLTRDSGSDEASRRAEAERIMKMFRAAGISSNLRDLPLTANAIDFLHKMERRLLIDDVSTKELFFLRDIKSKLEDYL